MNNYNNYNEERDTIDIKKCLIEIKKHFVLILIFTCICGVGVFLFSKYCITPKYESTTRIAVLSNESSNNSLNDVKTDIQLTSSYQEIINTRPVLEQVISNLKLDITYEQLSKIVNVYNPESTPIIRITVKHSDPMLAKRIVDEIANVSSKYYADFMNVDVPKIIERGQIPTKQISPNVIKNSIYGAIIGAVVILAIIILKFIFNDYINEEIDILDVLNVPVVASIPKVKKKKILNDNVNDLETIDDQNTVHLIKENGDYEYGESINTLRINLSFLDKDSKVVMITSAYPNEGKSLVSFELVQSLAKINKKVILIDTDIRNSKLITRFAIKKENIGLVDYLEGRCDYDEIVKQTSVNNLSIIFSGEENLNSSVLLEKGRFKELVSRASADFDFVIIDTPPIMSVPDGIIIAKNCDNAVLVVEKGLVNSRIAKKIKNQIESTDCKLYGVVLNKVDFKYTDYGYGYDGYGLLKKRK